MISFFPWIECAFGLSEPQNLIKLTLLCVSNDNDEGWENKKLDSLVIKFISQSKNLISNPFGLLLLICTFKHKQNCKQDRLFSSSWTENFHISFLIMKSFPFSPSSSSSNNSKKNQIKRCIWIQKISDLFQKKFT